MSGGNNNETTTIPKAYINYIFLDEQFKFVSGNANKRVLVIGKVNILRNGHLGAYLASLDSVYCIKQMQ